MNYFTPDLLARCGSEDDGVADRAEADWENAIETYNERLEGLKTRLPEKLQALLNNFNLHDASVKFGSLTEHSFAVALELVADSQLVVIKYDLVDAPRVVTRPIDNGPYLWLYDEIDLDGDEEFSHSILFSKGLELRVSFCDLGYEVYEAGTAVRDSGLAALLS